MTGDLTMVLVPAIIFGASLFHFTMGFGSALVAMPFLSMLIGVRAAAPLLALSSPLLAIVILIKHKQAVQVRSVLTLLLSSLAGIPVGLFMLKNVDEDLMKSILALVLIGFCAYKLIKPRVRGMISERSAPLFGFLAGILGILFTTNGPPVIIYGNLRRWSAESFRASLQGFFLPSSFLIMISHGAAGLWTSQVLTLFAISMPMVVLSIVIGGWLAKKIPQHAFDAYVHISLILIGITLLAESLW